MSKYNELPKHKKTKFNDLNLTTDYNCNGKHLLWNVDNYKNNVERYTGRINKWLYNDNYINDIDLQRILLNLPVDVSELDWLVFSKVYSAGNNGITFQLTDTLTKRLFALKTPLYRSLDYDETIGDPDPLQYEYIVQLTLNELRSFIPNFPLAYGFFNCPSYMYDKIFYNQYLLYEVNPQSVSKFKQILVDQIQINNKLCNNDKKLAQAPAIIMENIIPATPLYEMSDKSNAGQMLMYYIQVLLALQVAQDKYKFTHYDLHSKNVLMQDVSFSTSVFKQIYKNSNTNIFFNYIIHNKSYMVPSQYIPKIIDFGRSHINFSENITDDEQYNIINENPRHYKALDGWIERDNYLKKTIYKFLLKKYNVNNWEEFIQELNNRNINIPLVLIEQTNYTAIPYLKYDIILILATLYPPESKLVDKEYIYKVLYKKQIPDEENDTEYGINPSIFNPIWDLYNLGIGLFSPVYTKIHSPIFTKITNFLNENFNMPHLYNEGYAGVTNSRINMINKPIDMVEWIFTTFNKEIEIYINVVKQDPYITFNYSDDVNFTDKGLHYMNSNDKINIINNIKQMIDSNLNNILTNLDEFQQLKCTAELYNISKEINNYILSKIDNM